MATRSGQLDAWYAAADELLRKLRKQKEFPEDVKELIKFLERIGYEVTEKKKTGKGSHSKYELRNKSKFSTFLAEMGITGFDIESLPVGAAVTVANAGMAPGTIKGVLDRVFGLDDLGQKPPKK